MEIYIEIALIDNLLIDFIILFLSSKMLAIKSSKVLMFFSALFGAICALLMPLLALPVYWLLIIKLSIGGIMCLICFPTKKFSKFMRCFLAFVTNTAILGGVSFLTLFLLGAEMTFNGLVSYNINFPLGIIYFLVLCYSYVMVQAIKYFTKKYRAKKFIYSVKISTKKSSLKTDAYLDTGNLLCEPTTNAPIIVVGFKTFRMLCGRISLQKVLRKQLTTGDIQGAKYILANGVNDAKSEMLVFPIEEIVVDFLDERKTLKNIYAGLSLNRFQSSISCDVLLNAYCV